MSGLQTILLYCVALSILVGPVSSCYTEIASKCPNYELVNQLSMIPIPDPDRLNTVCSQIRTSLQCILGPAALGKCQATVKTFYTSILNVVGIPCVRLQSDYLAGRHCWKSPQLKQMMTICYMKHQNAIKDDYCSGQKEFVNCVMDSVTTVPYCGDRERRVLSAMVIRSYNDNGLVLSPPCRTLTTPSPGRRITTTATTKTTTQTTTKPTTTAAIFITASPTSQTLSDGLLSTSSDDDVVTTSRSLEFGSTTKQSEETGVTRASRSTGNGLVPMATAYGVVLLMSVRLV